MRTGDELLMQSVHKSPGFGYQDADTLMVTFDLEPLFSACSRESCAEGRG